MELLTVLFLLVGVGGGVWVYRMGSSACWHTGWSVAAALVPLLFTFFLGLFGLLIAFAFIGAIWKLTT